MNKLSIQLDIKSLSQADFELIEQAEIFATKIHDGQKRASGEPYIIHPRAVAQTVADWGLGASAIAAAWLHDTVEDTVADVAQVDKLFGPKVAGLVDGLTKLQEIDTLARSSQEGVRHDISMENVRKLLLAMNSDVRVVMVKLADRLHNLQTLKYLPEEKQRRIARESLEIYAPLADRLGMGQLKASIEDLSFRFYQPEDYKRTERLVAGEIKQAQRYLAALKRFLTEQLAAASVEVVRIEGRQKHVYSIYRKLGKADSDIGKIYDLMAVRIVVPEVADCYQVLGILHQNFKPLIYRIKDYIAVPKPNGYRSLHTTVFALDGRITEIQIRTPAMHEEAERGLAAHFAYDQHKNTKAYKAGRGPLPAKMDWMAGLSEAVQASSGGELAENLSFDMLNKRIYVFSPQGDLYDLPEGATSVDFAFAVHSDIGLRTAGAKVNGRMVPLETQLANRDVVEILTRKTSSPNRDWLSFVKTTQAKSRIRAWFRSLGREDNIASGRAELEAALKAWKYHRFEEIPEPQMEEALRGLGVTDTEALLAAIGEGAVAVGQVIRRLFPPEPRPKANIPSREVSQRVIVMGQELPYQLGKCCEPKASQAIIGYITRGSGVTVHRRNCSVLPPEPDRLIACRWDIEGAIVCRLRVDAENRVGLLRDVTAAVSNSNVNIGDVLSSHPEAGRTHIEFDIEVADLFVVARIIKQLSTIAGVESVTRTE